MLSADRDSARLAISAAQESPWGPYHGPGGFPLAASVGIACSAFSVLLLRHIQCLSAGTAGEQRAPRQQSQFDHSARHDRVRKTLVDSVKPPQLAAL